MHLSITAWVALAIFVLGYCFIAFEHTIRVNKSAIALAMGGLLWVLVVISGVDKPTLAHDLESAGSEIFSIIAFLLAAMTLIEILIHYNFFDFIQQRIARWGLHDKGQFLVIATLSFFLSAIFDNLTVTIVMIQMARRFFRGRNLVITASGIVILANAGGAWSPIGDVTTIMIWLAGKISAWDIVRYGFAPSLILAVVSTALLHRSITTDTKDSQEKKSHEFTPGEVLVIVTCILTFALPLLVSLVGLPPYMGLLLGLGLVWILVERLQVRSTAPTHLEARIETMLQKADISSLKFFIGILLSVTALQSLGLLENLSMMLYGAHQHIDRVIAGNILLGLASAVIDNVPLTAIAIDIIHTDAPQVWALLALSAGTGGSLLSIGSVAGVVAMGMVKELNFQTYIRIAFIPAFAGYVVAMGVWLLQYSIL